MMMRTMILDQAFCHLLTDHSFIIRKKSVILSYVKKNCGIEVPYYNVHTFALFRQVSL